VGKKSLPEDKPPTKTARQKMEKTENDEPVETQRVQGKGEKGQGNYPICKKTKQPFHKKGNRIKKG